MVLPKDDPFWLTNQPHNLWNCKCDWTETYDDVTDKPNAQVSAAKGLQGNPAVTGQIFSDDASYFKPVIKNEKAETEVQQCFYQDSQSKLKINVWADATEIADNVRTGRILADNYKSMDISIAEHLIIKDHTNPEYIINDMKADAKRIEQWNVASGFKSALEQDCKSVIIDLYKLENKRFNMTELIKSIRNRYADFTSGRINQCYIVWKNKSVCIDKNIFKNISTSNKYSVDITIKNELQKLLK